MADSSKYPTRIAPYGLRMPDDLKNRIAEVAKANNRSMNAEIVATLEEKYPDYSAWNEFSDLFSRVSDEDREAILRLMKSFADNKAKADKKPTDK